MNNSKFTRRLAFYLGGVVLGFIAVYFFFGDRDLPAVWPKGKVREQIINAKPADSLTICAIKHFGMEEDVFKKWVKEADVNFSDSYPRETPCPIYAIEGKLQLKDTRVFIQSCDSTFAITKAELIPALTPIEFCK